MNTQNNNNKYKFSPTVFNIASHNTRSLLNPLKQQLLVDLYSINSLDIIALQKTNFITSLYHFPLKTICNDKFIPFFSADTDARRSGFGIGFLVKKYLTDHIFHHSSYFNRNFLSQFLIQKQK